MQSLKNFLFRFTPSLSAKHALMLAQFFLIIFVYHILKDLKDTLVVTASDAGAEVIPFIKIWVILPFSILASYCFIKVYSTFGKAKTLYIFAGLLLSFYALFAFALYPNRDLLHLKGETLSQSLPTGLKGLVSMLCNWSYTAFYLSAELWSMMILSVLFWGQVNDANSMDEAKGFYPLCVVTGNCAGIFSGQVSRYLSHTLTQYTSWQNVLQLFVLLVILAGFCIMLINRRIAPYLSSDAPEERKTAPLSFKESLLTIIDSRKLLCIAALVVGFSLTNNLIEVIWKGTIKNVYPTPHAYNAYVNQLTSMIGVLSVGMFFVSRRLFKTLDWRSIAIITPAVLFATSLLFFSSLLVPEGRLAMAASLFDVAPYYLVMTLGSIHYVCALTSKYTLFDTCKEMSFLSIGAEERMRAKSVIDSVGSRLGKSGASCLYQVLLVLFGSTAGNVPIVAATSLLIIAISVKAARTLKQQDPVPSVSLQ